MAAVDGTGLRYAVFFAGCPLRCVCCHNPDTWFSSEKTIGAEELESKLCRYRPYFKKDGGVTFSGGEPLLQAAFLKEMIPLLKRDGIAYALDTSGCVELTDEVKTVLDHSQLVILDLKYWDDASYRAYTGQGMEKTLAVADYLNAIGKKTWIRTVVIPGINDTPEIIARYLPYIRRWPCAQKYELLAFHTMGFYKYDKLGLNNPLQSTPALDPDARSRLQAFVDAELS
jgi:pyruvate formate lyase activating enzyme